MQGRSANARNHPCWWRPLVGNICQDEGERLQAGNGLDSLPITLPETASTHYVATAVKSLNVDPRVYSILLQHPVPKQVDDRLCFDTINLSKDVNGVTSPGYVRMASWALAFHSATPDGILTLFKHYGIALEGKEAVVVGRSLILGKPMAAMMLNANATATICHSNDLESLVKRADIVVGAG